MPFFSGCIIGCGFESAVRIVWPSLCCHTHSLMKSSSKPLWPFGCHLGYQPVPGYEQKKLRCKRTFTDHSEKPIQGLQRDMFAGISCKWRGINEYLKPNNPAHLFLLSKCLIIQEGYTQRGRQVRTINDL